MVVVLVTGGLLRDRSYQAVLIHLVFASWAVAVVLMGETIRNRVHEVDELRARTRLLEQTRDAAARTRVAEERVRIARDLHDVVAHSLASISIQAGMAAHVLDRQPDEAREALMAIKSASKQALAELRATLDVLRDTTTLAPLHPTAGLAQLASVVATVEQTGLAVNVESDGLDPGRPLPSAIDVTAYRIIQESLTNAMRHATGATRVEVRIQRHRNLLEVEVIDDGRPDPADPAEWRGHGLRGMVERASLVRGRVRYGPRQDGPGYRVHADLPIPRAVKAAEGERLSR
jgi:signal transduction histidine kinase